MKPKAPRPDLRAMLSHRHVRALAPAAVLVGLGLWLLWPMPAGHMPLSADHTVHLTRIYLWAGELATGHVRGFSPTWFFGAPVGELYPVLGDAVVIAFRVLTLGLLHWSTAYALGVTVAFLAGGLVMLRLARAAGLSPLAGVVAGALVMLDAGQYREGGWIYTVTYGVWPQAFATALSWWALAETWLAVREQNPTLALRRGAGAGVVMAAAVLAHPMSLPFFVCAGGLLLGFVLREAGPRSRRASVASALGIATLAVAAAAWWLFPMLEHRAFMASYGWLWRSLAWSVEQAAQGALTQNMPAPVGYLAMVGIASCVVWRRDALPLFAALAVTLWFLSTREAFWSLRLDWLSEGFTHVQYQRFLLSAKPGLFLLAASCIDRLVVAPNLRPRPRAALAVAGLAILAHVAVEQVQISRAQGVGHVQVERFPGQPKLARHYDDLLAYMRQQVRASDDGFVRFAVRAPRNVHWFMDAPVYTGAAVYKVGFTPGDNFVHKPESARTEVLRALGVGQVIVRSDRPRPNELARFGPFAVLPGPAHDAPAPVAWIEGPGDVQLREVDLEAGVVTGSVSNAGPDSRLNFAISGYPRFELAFGEEVVPFDEVAVWGSNEPLPVSERASYNKRGGKVHGDDGSEPTLISAPARDGAFSLRYRARRPRDVLLGLLSFLALAGTLALARFGGHVIPWLTRLWPRLRPAFHPALGGALVVAGLMTAGARMQASAARESTRAVAWLRAQRVQEVQRVEPGPLKTDMLIRPTIRMHARPGADARVVFTGVPQPPGGQWTGYAALDDDSTKQQARGSHEITLEVRESDSQEWTVVTRQRVRHRPGRQPLTAAVPEDATGPFDLRITARAVHNPPPLGIDLELGGAP